MSIVIPVHNEKDSLPILMSELARVVETIPYPLEVLFVDDVSNDGSSGVLDYFQSEYVFVRALHLDKRGGQTGCYQRAFQQARGKYIVRIDSDLQDDPRDLAQFLPYFEQDYDLVMGLRELRKHRKLLRACSLLYDSLVVFLFDSPLHTNTSSFVAFKAEHVRGIRFKKNDHRYLPLISLHRGAKKVKEVVVVNRERQFGSSKYRALQKVILGVPEVIYFFLRMSLGYYSVEKQPIPVTVERRESNEDSTDIGGIGTDRVEYRPNPSRGQTSGPSGTA